MSNLITAKKKQIPPSAKSLNGIGVFLKNVNP